MPGLASQIQGGGFSGGQVIALNGTQNNSVTAAGTTRATATALTNATNNITTGTSLQGVALPSGAIPGDDIVVYNSTGAAIVVYPQNATSKINQLGAGVGFNLSNNTGVQCLMVTATQWVAFLSA